VFYLGTQAGSGGSVLQSIRQFAAVSLGSSKPQRAQRTQRVKCLLLKEL